MSTTAIKTDPTPRELRTFSALWAAFFIILGLAARSGAQHFHYPAAVMLLCVLVSLAFNRDIPRRSQALGFLFPAILFAIWGVDRLAGPGPGAERPALLVVLAAIGAGGAAGALGSPGFARRLYRGWSLATLPIGWTISHALLALVFYLVVTPVGLLTRLGGRDPMQRSFDPGATTYWIARSPTTDPRRYFRQF